MYNMLSATAGEEYTDVTDDGSFWVQITPPVTALIAYMVALLVGMNTVLVPFTVTTAGVDPVPPK